jgi:hypothetical protein
MRSFIVPAVVGFAVACHPNPTPVPTYGHPSSIAALAGKWSGTYQGTQSGRNGSISFTIRVTGDSAYGDVLMDWPPGIPIVRPIDDPAAHRLHAPDARFLAIIFVAVGATEVEGALEPYVAPDCECTVRTVFGGQVRGDTIRGTFITRGAMLAPQTGVWIIVRR